MRIMIRRVPESLGGEVIQLVERRLTFALGRFGERVTRVSLYFEDVNGPRGGIDLRCRAVAKITGIGEVVVVSQGSQVESLVDSLAERLAMVVARRLERSRFGQPRIASDGQPGSKAFR